MATEPNTERQQFGTEDRVFDYERRRKILRIGQTLMMVILLSYIILPLYWVITSTFTPIDQLLEPGFTLFPNSITLDNFNTLFTETDFPNQLKNSIIVAVMATSITAILATLGGYGLARSNFRSKRSLARVVLVSYMVPRLVLGIPLYLMFYNLGLLNSHIALALAHAGGALPFSMWLMWQYFQTLSVSFEESAWISGASRLRTLWEIVIPMSKPGIIAVSIFAFAGSWSDFTLATILLTNSEMYTFPIGLHSFLVVGEAIDWGLLNAGALLVMVPAFLLVFFMQKYILEGFNVGH